MCVSLSLLSLLSQAETEQELDEKRLAVLRENDWALISQLGSGVYGDIFAAYDGKRLFALKFTKPEIKLYNSSEDAVDAVEQAPAEDSKLQERAEDSKTSQLSQDNNKPDTKQNTEGSNNVCAASMPKLEPADDTKDSELSRQDSDVHADETKDKVSEQSEDSTTHTSAEATNTQTHGDDPDSKVQEQDKDASEQDKQRAAAIERLRSRQVPQRREYDLRERKLSEELKAKRLEAEENRARRFIIKREVDNARFLATHKIPGIVDYITAGFINRRRIMDGGYVAMEL